jgi:hypothetical protein
LDAWLLLAKVVEGSKVALSEIEDVDVVANGGTIVGGIVCSKF